MLLNFAAAMASYSALSQQSTDGAEGSLVDEADSSDETSQQLPLPLPSHLSALGRLSSHLSNQGQLPPHMARLVQLSPHALRPATSPEDLRPQTNSPSSSGGRAASSPDARVSASQNRIMTNHALGAIEADRTHHQGVKRKSSQILDDGKNGSYGTHNDFMCLEDFVGTHMFYIILPMYNLRNNLMAFELFV